ncbi:MAG: phosphoadenosine phosphosulfate reductase family protein [Candidatus Spyradenecus sp.]
MIKKHYTNVDVVTAARQRIRNLFANGVPISLSVSGGKDSICLNHLVFTLCASGEIDKSLLTVDFVDEEAIYPCVERVVLNMRRQWLSLGVPFNWWAIECKHFNCFNALTNDESFLCWDRYKQDVWVRQRPPFALTGHPLFRPRKDTYQDFMIRLNAGKITLIGVRVAESIQRLDNVARNNSTDRLYPIYDWTDTDVWRYIAENALEYPDAYEHMYRTGVGMNKMRISQFFSVDTAASLVKMCEFYPDLFNRICKREPNAYMAMLYFDTELYRRKKSQGRKDNTDYKQKVFDLFKQPERFETKAQQRTFYYMRRFVTSHSAFIDQKAYKTIYQALVGGDPKGRTQRALYTQVFGRHKA